MRLINYSHPITESQKMDIGNATFVKNIEIENIAVSIDTDRPILLQIARLLPRLDAHESILVRLPGFSEVAALILQLMLDKVALCTIVLLKSRKTAIGVDYQFAECIVLTGNKED